MGPVDGQKGQGQRPMETGYSDGSRIRLLANSKEDETRAEYFLRRPRSWTVLLRGFFRAIGSWGTPIEDPWPTRA